MRHLVVVVLIIALIAALAVPAGEQDQSPVAKLSVAPEERIVPSNSEDHSPGSPPLHQISDPHPVASLPPSENWINWDPDDTEITPDQITISPNRPWRRGETATVSVAGKEIVGEIVTINEESTVLGLRLHDQGPRSFLHFDFDGAGNLTQGTIISFSHQIAYRLIRLDEENKIAVKVLSRQDVIPDEENFLPGVQAAPENGEVEESAGIQSGPAGAPPILESNPGAPGVIYLDFDGHTTTGTSWNTFYNSGNPIVSAASTLNNTQITETWQRVAEDFSPFTINVTTSEDVFLAAGQTTRIRVVISPTNWYNTNAGGVAYLTSWSFGGAGTPVYAFTAQLANGPKYIAECSSHETGHALGLGHDGTTTGTEYYQGPNDWSPIMGNSYYDNITHWSRGEYTNANNTQDDLTVMDSYGGVDYRSDTDGGNSTGAAAQLNVSGTSINQSGIIEQATDVDYFRFISDGGSFSVTISSRTVGSDANLFFKLQLYDSDGALVSTLTEGATSVTYTSASLAAGTYYLEISGVGDATNGFSDYASIGKYTITGTASIQDQTPIPTSTPTITPTRTVTPTPTNTRTPTPTRTPTNTPIVTNTPTPTVTNTPGVSPSATPTSIASATHTATPVPTQPAEPPPAESECRNIAFSSESVQSYGGKQDRRPGTVSANGESLTLTGNAWKSVTYTGDFDNDTYLEFDFETNGSGDFQAVGFDRDNSVNPSSIFTLSGAQVWGIRDFSSAYVVSGRRHYRIPLGLYARESFNRLLFISDFDGRGPAPQTTFSNVKVCSGAMTNWLDSDSISNYGGEFQNGGGSIAVDGSQVTLSGSVWKKIPLPLVVKGDTVLSFDFSATSAGQVYAIGFDTDSTVSSPLMFQVGGSQPFATPAFEVSGMPGHFEIPVGQFVTGTFRYLVLAADDDNFMGAQGTFENIEVSGGETPPDGSLYLRDNASCAMQYSCDALRCNLRLKSKTPVARSASVIVERSLDNGESWKTLATSRMQTRSVGLVRIPLRKAVGSLVRMRVPSQQSCVTAETFVALPD